MLTAGEHTRPWMGKIRDRPDQGSNRLVTEENVGRQHDVEGPKRRRCGAVAPPDSGTAQHAATATVPVQFYILRDQQHPFLDICDHDCRSPASGSRQRGKPDPGTKLDDPLRFDGC